MAAVVLTCVGCGVRIRTAQPEQARTRSCPRCGTGLDPAVERALGGQLLAGPEDNTPAPEPAFPDLDLKPEADDRPQAGAVAARRRTWRVLFVFALAVALLGEVIVSARLRGRSEESRRSAPRARTESARRPRVHAPNRRTAPAADGSIRPAGYTSTTGGLAVPPPPSPLVGPPPPPRPIPVVPRGKPGKLGPPPPPEAVPAPGPPPPQPVAGSSVARAAPEPKLPATPAPVQVETPRAVPGTPAPLPPAPPARRILVRDKNGRELVTRVYSQSGGRTTVILPDGQLGWPDGLAYTELPFHPATADEIIDDLVHGPFQGFSTRRTAHYVILFNGSPRFAEQSGNLLESLYSGLKASLTVGEVPVQDAEFPLVAIIYDTERAFRARSPSLAPEVQAYYEIITNRIYFYERSDRDQQSPEVAALRKPQTVAHEGTHQILQNIGVQPRLAPWPIWLVEGLAEYCAPTTTKKGAQWAGFGKVNPLHMATIRDLDDQRSLTFGPRGQQAERIGWDPKTSLVEYLVTRTKLTPTDYALAWAVTHYLTHKRNEDFLVYLKTLSRLQPLERQTPEQQLATFRSVFGSDLRKLDRAILKYLSRLKYDELPYYAVLFQQEIRQGVLKRAVLVSQSPSMIRQWLDSNGGAMGGPSQWEVHPFPTRTRASLFARQWLNGP